MLKTIESVYHDGKVELTEVPKDVRDETRVLVTFLEPQAIDLRVRGIDEARGCGIARPFGDIRQGLGQSRDGRV